MSVIPADIAVAIGVAAPDPNDSQFKQWEMWIADAEMLIETRAAQLGINLYNIDEAKRRYVVREAVVAQVKRPDDSTQITITVDDATTSKSYRSGKGRVAILDEWWSLLGLTDPKGAFAIDMAPARPIGDWFPTTTDDWRGW